MIRLLPATQHPAAARTRSGAVALALGVALVAATIVTAGAVPARAGSHQVTFEGGGWGHSVGMSQYGAYGQALEGRSAAQILAHYYTGSSVAKLGVGLPVPAALTHPTDPNGAVIWVNLAQERAAVELHNRTIWGTGGPVTVTRGAESIAAQPGEMIAITASQAGCTVALSGGAGLPEGSCSIDLAWDGWEDAPQTRIDLTRTRGVANGWANCTQRDWNKVPSLDRVCSYGRGTLHIRPDDQFATKPSFHVVIEIDVDDYVLGISEMPYYWGRKADGTPDPLGLEALKVQAIAARSYALHRAADRGDPALRQWCWCHIYDTTIDQRYVGWGHGEGSWIDASNSTAGLVSIHPTEKDAFGNLIPIEAFYSSSTFGRTEDNEIGFGTPASPYLRTVDDHWSADPALNPNAEWSKTMSLTEIASILGMNQVTAVEVTKWSTSGAADVIRFHGTPAAQSRNARFLRSMLGLKSPQVTAVLSGAPPPAPTPPAPPSPPVPIPPVTGPATVGLHDPATGIWHLQRAGGQVSSFYYGNPADVPFAGDWDCNGTTTVGLYRVSAGFLFLRNSNSEGIADVEIFYGDPGDLPIAGDWNGDGCETIGIFRPRQARFYLRNTNTAGFADISAEFGQTGDVPLAGDWDGDGIDSIGVYRPSTRTVYLANSAAAPIVDVTYVYANAAAGDRIVAGDWDGDGDDTIGVFRPSDSTFYLRDTFTQANANVVIPLGGPTMNPIAGFWGS